MKNSKFRNAFHFEKKRNENFLPPSSLRKLNFAKDKSSPRDFSIVAFYHPFQKLETRKKKIYFEKFEISKLLPSGEKKERVSWISRRKNPLLDLERLLRETRKKKKSTLKNSKFLNSSYQEKKKERAVTNFLSPSSPASPFESDACHGFLSVDGRTKGRTRLIDRGTRLLFGRAQWSAYSWTRQDG